MYRAADRVLRIFHEYRAADRALRILHDAADNHVLDLDRERIDLAIRHSPPAACGADQLPSPAS